MVWLSDKKWQEGRDSCWAFFLQGGVWKLQEHDVQGVPQTKKVVGLVERYENWVSK